MYDTHTIRSGEVTNSKNIFSIFNNSKSITTQFKENKYPDFLKTQTYSITLYSDYRNKVEILYTINKNI